MGISDGLTGTPWHVDRFTREEGDPKRHRSRCVHYRKTGRYASECNMYGHCIGTAHCDFYREESHENDCAVPDEPKKAVNKPANEPVVKKSSGSASVPNSYSKRFKIGAKVRHRVFGLGRVKGIKGKYIRIVFDSGKDSEFDAELCLKNKIIITIT